MNLYVHERQMGFPPTAEPPRPGGDGGSGTQRYPDGVEVCSSPEVYYHALVRSQGELCVRLLGPSDGAVLRHVRDTTRSYLPRPGRPPSVRAVPRVEALDELRRCRPVLVAVHEVADLLGEDLNPADIRAGPSGRLAADASQSAVEADYPAADVGQPAADVGQPAADVGQPIELPEHPTPVASHAGGPR